jgi:hypothetical protein
LDYGKGATEIEEVMAWKVLDQFKVPGRLLGHKREVA